MTKAFPEGEEKKSGKGGGGEEGRRGKPCDGVEDRRRTNSDSSPRQQQQLAVGCVDCIKSGSHERVIGSHHPFLSRPCACLSALEVV